MGAEVVTLRLQQVGRQPVAAVAVVIRQGRTERRHRQPHLDRRGDHPSPAWLRLFDRGFEEVVQQQVLELRVLVERALDVLQEPAADDAAATPQEGDVAVVELPAEFLRGGVELHVALRVAAEFGGVERLADVFDELLPVAGKLAVGAEEHL